MTGVLERRPNRRLPPRSEVRAGTGQELTQSRRAFDYRRSRRARCGYLVDEPAFGASLHTAQPTGDSTPACRIGLVVGGCYAPLLAYG
jgi:hypothetical protein